MASWRVRASSAAGAVAAPLLLVVIAVDGATRPGYDVWQHGVSQLVMGELGWLERLTYVVCGLLTAAFAVGTRRLLSPGPGRTWGPILITAVAVGLVVAGCSPPTRPSATRSASQPR